MNYKLIKELQEAWKDHADPSGFLRAAHSPDNCLLVYWYNSFTGDFRKTSDKDAQHKDLETFGLEQKDLPGYMRGRVFKFNNQVYLMVYVFGVRITSYSFLDNLYNLVYQTLGTRIDRVIDDNGDDLKAMFESWKYYTDEKLHSLKEIIRGS